jgi:two-component system, sensor histidine kinase
VIAPSLPATDSVPPGNVNGNHAADHKPDPEDGTHILLNFLMFRGCDVLGAALYLTALHTLLEGVAERHLLQVLMGLGGGLMIATVIVASRYHERNLNQQFERRRRAERAADALASMSLAKARFFAAVSHDLRQPLHAIGLYLDPLDQLSQETNNQDVQRAVTGIRLCWRALDGLLAQAMDIARMDAGALQPQMVAVDLTPLVRSLVTQHWPTAERAGVRLVVLAEEGRFALADPLMLTRVVSNLLDNAIKFSPHGATVAVAVRRGSDAWRLQVRDAGRGIAKDAQELAFEEFVQIDSAARDRQLGHGLGLAISRRFMRLMRGNLTVRSDVGRGCCMTVTLQRAAAPVTKAI